MFVLFLGILHNTLRAYSHEAYAIGTAYDTRPPQFHHTLGMFVNTVLIPFLGGKQGGEESFRELQDRWTSRILPHAKTPYDMISSLGYGCNVYFAYNIGLFGTKKESSMLQHEFRTLKVPGNMTAQFDLTVTLHGILSGNGSIYVKFESGIGPWPGLEDRFMLLINHFLNEDAIEKPITPILLPSKKAQVLRWGQGESKPVRQVCLHHMFEE